MQRYHDYAETFRDEKNKIFTGISHAPDLSQYEIYFKTHIITPSQEFRPDKIAHALFGSPDLSWVLDIINDFTNGISDYTRNTTIKYLPQNKLISLGVL